jgi:hypothetical protein
MLMIQETYVNRTRDLIYGEGEPYEPFTDDIGRLFRNLQAEYGRCRSSVYVDRPDGSGNTDRIGWVFESRQRYEGSGPAEYYLREVWVTLLDAEWMAADEVRGLHPRPRYRMSGHRLD